MIKQQRQKETYEILRRLQPRQTLYLFISVAVIFAILISSNILRLNMIRKSISDLETELSELQILNDTSEPLYWENRDSTRIFRDIAELNRAYNRLFTFRTLEDMAAAKEKAIEFGFSNATLNLLYDPNEALSQDIMLGSEVSYFVDCYYADSDVFLIGIYDNFYRYLSRVSLDVLADYNITLILLLDVDESGQIVNDVCYIGALPAESIF